MTCRESQEQLKAFLAGNLSGDASKAIRGHLASCRDCAALLSPADRVELLPALEETILPAKGLQARFHARLEAHKRERLGKTRSRLRHLSWNWSWPARLSAAGALAVAVLAAGILLQFRSVGNYASAPSDVEISIAQNLPLLQDMPVIENLEMLEDFDSIDNMGAGPGPTRAR